MSTMIKGRGTSLNPEGRFEPQRRVAFDDGWDREEEEVRSIDTIVRADPARTIISRNDSPDIVFDQSINPYKGCEHGCIYCFARPAHSYLNLSPGLDFETKLFYKKDAAQLLDAELRKPGYLPKLISLGANTDPYQPIEREYRVTRSLLEVLSAFHHPLGVITKGTLIERDIDLLADLARRNLVVVGMTLTTLDDELKRRLEPRAPAPAARLRTMRRLAEAGIPVTVMVSPIIPFINDAEIEQALEAGRDAGASRASYVLVRLPHEVKDLFRQWLDVHYPLKARHVMSLIQQMRGGRDYDAAWGTRMRGEGAFAQLIEQRFRKACQRLGLNRERPQLDLRSFAPPPRAGDQMRLL